MMKNNIRLFRGLFAALLLTAPAGSLLAQDLHTGYFDDNYLYRFQMNPAAANENNFVSMPGLGNLNISTNGTIGVSHILYNVDGQTTTFLNPMVDASKVLSGLRNKSRIGVALREQILAGGFKAWGGYNTVSISERADVNIGLPKDIFRLAKEGVSNSVYDLSPLSARAGVWTEISLGHSRDLNESFRVGGNLKFLLGSASALATVNDATLALHEDTWIASVDAKIEGSLSGLSYKQDYNKHTDRNYVNGVEIKDFKPFNGFGMALDLGAEYVLNDDWKFSAAILDLGFISWSNNMVASTNGKQTVVTDEYTFNVDNNDSWNKFRDNLSMLYQLDDLGDTGSRTSGIGASFNLGARYTLPVYRKVHFGFLNYTHINGNFSWTDFRLSGTIQPVKCFSATASFGLGTFGASFGWLLNFNTKGFNLYLASDRTPGKLAKQRVPLNSNLNFNLGINFPF